MSLILQPRGLKGNIFRSKYEIIALHRCYMVPTLLPVDWSTIKWRQHAYKKLCAREKSFSLPEIFFLRLHRYLFAVTLIHTRIKKFFVRKRETAATKFCSIGFKRNDQVILINTITATRKLISKKKDLAPASKKLQKIINSN